MDKQYAIQEKTSAPGSTAFGRWTNDEDRVYSSLPAALRQLEDSRRELPDEPGQTRYRYRVVERVVTVVETVLDH